MPATLMPTALPVAYARLMIAVTAVTSAPGTATRNPYKAGSFGWPGGGREVKTEETAAEVIVTGVPDGR